MPARNETNQGVGSTTNARIGVVNWIPKDLFARHAVPRFCELWIWHFMPPLHVFVPIHPDHDADEVRIFADQLGHRLTLTFPKELTVEPRIVERKGRVYLDPFRNGFGQTVVALYSVRHAPGAPVSTPLSWSEVTPMLKPVDFNIGNFRGRLQEKDPWADFFECRQNLSQAQKLVTHFGLCQETWTVLRSLFGLTMPRRSQRSSEQARH